jgi:hypothetical protein
MTTEDSDTLLKSKPPGSYLLRFAASVTDVVLLSGNTGHDIVHVSNSSIEDNINYFKGILHTSNPISQVSADQTIVSHKPAPDAFIKISTHPDPPKFDPPKYITTKTQQILNMLDPWIYDEGANNLKLVWTLPEFASATFSIASTHKGFIQITIKCKMVAPFGSEAREIEHRIEIEKPYIEYKLSRDLHAKECTPTLHLTSSVQL